MSDKTSPRVGHDTSPILGQDRDGKHIARGDLCGTRIDGVIGSMHWVAIDRIVRPSGDVHIVLVRRGPGGDVHYCTVYCRHLLRERRATHPTLAMLPVTRDGYRVLPGDLVTHPEHTGYRVPEVQFDEDDRHYFVIIQDGDGNRSVSVGACFAHDEVKERCDGW